MYQYTKPRSNRYAHTNCEHPEYQPEYLEKLASEKKSIEQAQQEEEDKKKLEKYIMELFQVEYLNPRIRKQINQYINEYKYTYSGILKALKYFYEVKGNSIEKSNGGIGIVPYIYKDSYNYYYDLWLAHQVNEDKEIQQYVPKVIEIVIPLPKRQPYRRKLFSFLDEEEAPADGK